jgi:hypothetical protein
MHKKVVYAVSSSGRDLYSVMTRVSAASIRISNPDVAIYVACDGQSVTAMRKSRDPLLDEVDDLVVCDTPAGDSGFRNRFVKTHLRRLVSGPFLFLDSDTFVRDDISEIFAVDADIACAPNHSKDLIEQQIWSGDNRVASEMGWRIRKDVYVNGGVIFYNETPSSARFADDWHQKWLKSYAIAKSPLDQPALNAAIFDTAPRLEILPHRFNAQFKMTPRVALDAALLHFYVSASIDDAPVTEVERLVDRLLKGDRLRHADVESIRWRSHPWRRDGWVDDIAARWVLKKGHFGSEARLWFQGHRVRSLAPRICLQCDRASGLARRVASRICRSLNIRSAL